MSAMIEKTQVRTLPVTGMSCASCAANVEKLLTSQNGVKSATVNYSNNKAYINYNPDLISPEKLRKEIQAIGYDLVIEEDSGEALDSKEKNRFRELKTKLIVAAVLSTPVFIISMFWHHSPQWLSFALFALTLPVVTFSGAEFYRNAWKQASRRIANMDTLVALGTGAAFLFSIFNTFFPAVLTQHGFYAHVYYEAAAVIITFLLAGRFLEERSKAKASAAIKKLMGLQPKTLTVLVDGNEKVIPMNAVNPGDIVILKPGEKTPVDGKVLKGETLVDESMISGEPLPVLKKKGDQVFTGTINQQGYLHIEATRVGSETVLAQIIAMVDRAQASKPPVQKIVDTIASIFVPIVIVLAMLTFLVWFFFGPNPSLTYAFITTISILIIACPCALGLATPTALVAGIGRGAENGILIRDTASLEMARKTEVLVLDKTGTLTEGKPGILKSWYHNENKMEDINQLLSAIESLSTHPLASAILDEVGQKDSKFYEPEEYENISGKGIRAKLQGKIWYAGNLALLEEAGVKIPDGLTAHKKQWLEEGHSLVFFADDKQVQAAFAITDAIKPDAANAVQSVRALGIEVVLLTGDNEASASKVALKTGIKNYKAGIMPEEKNVYIRKLQEEGKIVAMAGDGINDAAALAQANIGLAMASGSDIAMENAGITLMNSDPMSIVKALRLSKSTVRVIKQNLFWAFFYNIIAIPLAAGALHPITGILLDPMIAGAAMALSSVMVVTNSLRLRRMALT
jgi:P-type Cu2+ transporter